MADNPQSVGDILDRLNELAKRKDEVSVGEIVEALGNRSYGAFLMVPALLELSPIGGVPGVPTFLAVIIILFAGQMVALSEQIRLRQASVARSVDR